jgi:hypothetical protein
MNRGLSLLLIFAAIGWSTALAQSKAIATVEVKDESGAQVSGAEVTIVATSPSQAPRIVSQFSMPAQGVSVLQEQTQ